MSSDTSDNTGRMVNLLVPTKLYAPMVRTLARLMQGDDELEMSVEPKTNPAVPWPTTGETPSTDDIDWADVDNCRRLRGHLKNKAALTMLDMAADSPGKPIYISMVMKQADCTHGQASSGNGAITKAIRMVFGSKSQWPAPFNWDKDKGVAYYMMTPEVAAAWKASA